MKSLYITIPGKPYSNMRERHCSIKGRSWVYEAKVQKDRKKEVIECIKSQLPTDIELLDTPVRVSIRAHFPIPKSKSKYIQNYDYHSKKPDIDNIAKFYLDCMTKLILSDDSIVVSLNVYKLYSMDPEVTIGIEVV